MSRSKSISLRRGEISRRGYSAPRGLCQHGRSPTARRTFRIRAADASINTHTSSFSLRACLSLLVFVFPPSSPLFVPAAFGADQLSEPMASGRPVFTAIGTSLGSDLVRVVSRLSHNAYDCLCHRRWHLSSVLQTFYSLGQDRPQSDVLLISSRRS